MKFLPSTICPPNQQSTEDKMKRQRVKYFSPEEKRKLLDVIQKHYPNKIAQRSGFMYKLMFSTGLRLAETIHLNAGDLKDRSILVVIGKGNKEREIPLSLAIREEIRRFLDWKRMNDEDISPEAPLFISRKHRRIGSRGVQHDLDKWVCLAGLEGRYSPHALRHTVGFDLIRGTNNIRKVQEFLGHRSISTTQLYTHITKDELRECAELLICDPGVGYYGFSRN
jgi:integrase/recombinase XerC